MTSEKRPETLKGKTIKCTTTCGAFYLTLNNKDNKLFEIRIQLGKSGNCQRILLEHIGILYSILLQAGIPKDKLIKTLKKHCLKVNCGSDFMNNGKEYGSCLDYAADKILEELNEEKEMQKESN